VKSLATAAMLGSVSSKNLNDAGSIWDESTENIYNVCGDPWTRWGDASNSWDTYVKAYKSSGVYEENDFGANMESIYSSSAPPKSSQAAYYKRGVVGWKRPKDFYPDETPLLKGSLGAFTPQGIKQGGLSDCWFLAGITAIAENPDRMNSIVHYNSRQNYNH
jgi:hypothetical protein